MIWYNDDIDTVVESSILQPIHEALNNHRVNIDQSIIHLQAIQQNTPSAVTQQASSSHSVLFTDTPDYPKAEHCTFLCTVCAILLFQKRQFADRLFVYISPSISLSAHLKSLTSFDCGPDSCPVWSGSSTYSVMNDGL